jgi:hypothetical protein
MRRRGVFGYNLPPKSGASVSPADLGIVGVIGKFSRGIESVIEVNQNSEIPTKLGDYKSGYYGRYVVESLFTNAKGTPLKCYVRGHVASDAVQASKDINDQSAVLTLTLKAAYQDLNDKSLDGNNTGYTLTNGTRYSSTASTGSLISTTSITLASVVGFRVGDVLKITSSGPTVHYAKVSAKNEGTKTLTISALTNAVSTNDVVEAIGFKITTYRKNKNGVPSKVNIPENNIYLSLEPENTEFYVNNAFANHPYLKLVDGASVTTPIQNTYPSDVSTITYLASGSDGTAPASASDWNLYSNFDNKNIRFLLNTDTVLEAVNVAGESYCITRLDAPVWLYAVDKNQTVAQYKVHGAKYQRSNQVQGVLCAGWRNVSDPIGDGVNPTLQIPIHGALCGAWIYAIYRLGVHRAPAGYDVPLIGFVSTSEATEDLFTEDERTEILDNGVNICQFVQGAGLIVRSFRTLSTNTPVLFGHTLILQNFIKISSVESLAQVENRPNRLSALKSYANAIKDFGYNLYKGSFPFGIDPSGAFGEYVKEDGTTSTFEDVFTVQADEFNNTQTDIDNGEGNIYVYFYSNPLLESLAIGVGTMTPVSIPV